MFIKKICINILMHRGIKMSKNEDVIHTTLNAPRWLWRKLKVIAGEKGKSTNDLVVETLTEKFGSVEVTV